MTGMTEEKAVTLAVDVAAVGRAISFAKQFAAANAVKTSIEHKIIVVLDDVLTNIVSYGFDDPTGHEINIEFDLKRGGWRSSSPTTVAPSTRFRSPRRI